MRLSDGRASPVRTVKLARVGLVMVTFLYKRNNVTFRWIKRHTASCALRTGVVCCLPTCAQGSSAAVTGCVGCGTFFGTLGAPWSLVHMGGCLLCLSFPSCLQDLSYGGVPITGHAHWAEVGWGILYVTLGEFSGLHKNVLGFFWVVGVIPIMWCHIC